MFPIAEWEVELHIERGKVDIGIPALQEKLCLHWHAKSSCSREREEICPPALQTGGGWHGRVVHEEEKWLVAW